MSMDVASLLNGQIFVLDSDKAALNQLRHGITFDDAREAFFDDSAIYVDASPPTERRQACIGFTKTYKLLFVVHLLREGDVLRLISARAAEAAERKLYDDENE